MATPAANQSFNKIQLFLADDDFGWDETYYDTVPAVLDGNGNPTLASLVSTWNKAVKLASLRAAMLPAAPNTCFATKCEAPEITQMRVSNTGRGESRAPRVTLYGGLDGAFTVTPVGMKAFSNPIGVNANGVAIGQPLNPYDGVAVIFTDGYPSQSKRTIRGIPTNLACDQALNFGGIVAGSAPPWLAKWRAFANYITGPGALGAIHPVPQAWKASPLNVGAGAGATISSLGFPGPVSPSFPNILPQQNALGQLTFTLSQPFTFANVGATGAYGTVFDPCAFWLVIQGSTSCRRNGHINGVWRVVPLAPVGLTPGATYQTSIFTTCHSFLQVNLSCLGWATVRDWVVSPWQTVQLTRPASRKTGAPTPRHRGRIPTRR
jgi:hypothetical protein